MTAFDRFERELPELLTELSSPRVPQYLQDVLSQTARTRQRPGWTSIERWLPMDITARPPLGLSHIPWRMLGILALLALLLALSLVAVGSRQQRLPQPFGLAANGSFLFDRDGDIYAAAPGTSETELVVGATEDFAPLWSRDGTRFMFLREVNLDATLLMTAEADGSDIRALTSEPLEGVEWFDWSPDGAWLAVAHTLDGRPSISVVDAHGGGRSRELELGQVEPSSFVTWRPPAGEELIFLAHPGGVKTDLAVYAIRPDGTGLREIAVKRNESDPSLAGPTQVSFQNLSLSPDGSEAIFWNWETLVAPGRECFIHTLDLDTGEDRRMTYDPAATCELGPVWSPEGTTIAYEGDAPGTVSTSQVMVAPADGSTPARRVGPDDASLGLQHSFDFSPDGTKIILTFESAATLLVDVGTGGVEEAGHDLPALPSWQRLAP